MLTSYQQKTQLLLNDVKIEKFNLFDLRTYINFGRGQIAGDGECIRNFATLALSQGTRVYSFSSIILSSPSTGIQGVFKVRQALVQQGSGDAGTGSVWLHPRSFEWITLYGLNQVVPTEAIPTRWAQYGQGVTGSLYFDPVPDTGYTVNLDCVCYPSDLVDDTSTEVIPYPWTDVVPFYAAWYALKNAHMDDMSDKMWERVQFYMAQARRMSNPDLLPQNFSQAPPDPTMPGRLGLKPTRSGS